MIKKLTQDKETGEWIILTGADHDSLVEVLRSSDQAMATAAYDLEHDIRLKIELREAGKALKALVDQLVDNYEERKGKPITPENAQNPVEEVGVDVEVQASV